MDEKELESAVVDIAEGLGISDPVEDVKKASLVGEGDGNESIPTDDSTPSDESEVSAEVEVSEEVKGVEPVDIPPPPKTWRPDATKEWEVLPAVVRDEILKREEDMFKGIESYKQEAAIGKTIREVVSPYLPQLQAAGIDPIYQIQSLLHAHHTLVSGTDEQRKSVFRHLLNEYRVDLSETPDIFRDPEAEALNKTVADLQRKVESITSTQAETVREKLQREIAAFSTDPANVHFDTVVDDMTALIKAGLAKDLPDAYSQAIWRNPQTRALETARLTAEAEAKLKRENEGKVAKVARAASVNVKTSAKSGSGTAPIGSMDDTLNETLLNIKSRA
jgi:hypothetical protein